MKFLKGNKQREQFKSMETKNKLQRKKNPIRLHNQKSMQCPNNFRRLINETEIPKGEMK
jgi:hypothetical protein